MNKVVHNKAYSVLIVTGVIVTLFSIWGHLVSKSLPLAITAPLEINVVDQDTGDPISGVVVEALWSKIPFYALHPMTQQTKRILLMSNNNGRITVPGYFSIHFLSSIDTSFIYFHHPFYELGVLQHYEKHRRVLNNDGWGKLEIKNGNEILFSLKNLNHKYRDVKCELKFIKKEGHLQETSRCNDPTVNFFAEMRRAEGYYRLIKEANVRGLDDGLFPNVEIAENEWKEISRKIYQDSTEKPWWIENYKSAH